MVSTQEGFGEPIASIQQAAGGPIVNIQQVAGEVKVGIGFHQEPNVLALLGAPPNLTTGLQRG